MRVSEDQLDAIENGYLHKEPNIINDCLPLLNILRKTEKLIDVHILVGEKIINGHKLILGATIPYFHRMFIHAIESSIDVIEIEEEIDPQAFELIINYCYTGLLKITWFNIKSLLVCASFLQLKKVSQACCEFMENNLDASNVLGVQAFAHILDNPDLFDMANEFIIKKFQEIIEFDEYMKLDINQITEIISNDQLKVFNEEKVFEAVIRWVKSDEANRKKHLPELLKQVRFPFLKLEFLINNVAKEGLIKSSLDCRNLIDEVRNCHLMKESRSLVQNFPTKPRKYYSLKGLIYAVTIRTKINESVCTFEVYDSDKNSWDKINTETMLHSIIGVEVMNNKLYAIGSYNSANESFKSVEVFDPCNLEKSWSRIEPMKFIGRYISATVLNEKLYVYGGYKGNYYDPINDKWKILPPISMKREMAGMLAFENSIYVVGGQECYSTLKSVEKFDPLSEKRTEIEPMLTQRHSLGVTSMIGKIYVCGGCDGTTDLQTAEVFDPEENKWSFIAPMNVKRRNAALVANAGKLYAIGGYDGESQLNSAEMYDPDTDEWKLVAPMIELKGYVGVGVLI